MNTSSQHRGRTRTAHRLFRLAAAATLFASIAFASEVGAYPAPQLPEQRALVVATPGAFFTAPFGVAWFPEEISVVKGTGADASSIDPDILVPHHIIASDDPDAIVPLFETEDIILGDIVPIVGVEDLEVGRYAFKCKNHPLMVGALNVTAG